jgi:hypothetical protein
MTAVADDEGSAGWDSTVLPYTDTLYVGPSTATSSHDPLSVSSNWR